MDVLSRRLHSFTLTVTASDEVEKMKRGTKSLQVSKAIEKYANDYKLTPEGVKYWQNLRRIEENLKKAAWVELKELREEVSTQGVKGHLVGLLRCLNPFPRRKQV